MILLTFFAPPLQPDTAAAREVLCKTYLKHQHYEALFFYHWGSSSACSTILPESTSARNVRGHRANEEIHLHREG